ncbi:hypothetical protein NUW54_g14417 [Trametes sanguinea]|uniref:Uncharacterized protein n=1 Tax=Trametes sanguinea TaxID=158606 RepID=A0ACC1MEI9_9APHY|nr:hypothetical protein NUW54_g14417 [Trametes sanguinea]
MQNHLLELIFWPNNSTTFTVFGRLQDACRTCIAVKVFQVALPRHAEDVRRLCSAKTRMQLQGELMRHGGNKVYSNVFDALIKTWRNEGFRGVQRGLGPALLIGVTQDSAQRFTSGLLRAVPEMAEQNAWVQPNPADDPHLHVRRVH